jgi:hypothetical protein
LNLKAGLYGVEGEPETENAQRSVEALGVFEFLFRRD